VEKHREALKQEYGALETQLSVSFSPAPGPEPDQALTADSASKLLTLLLTLPHGVIKFSHTVPGTFA
jgi:dipeptidase D